MQLQPKQKMIINMMMYGMTLGGLAGALSTITLILTSSVFEFIGGTLPVMILETLSIAIFGLIFGGIFGVVAGAYSGVGMSVMTTLFFHDIFSQSVYKFAMGIITAICTGLFLYTGLWHLRLDGIDIGAWNTTLLMGVVFAVYASQRVASFYLFDWSIRKQQVYA